MIETVNDFLIVCQEPRIVDNEYICFVREVEYNHPHLLISRVRNGVILGRKIPFNFEFIPDRKLETRKRGFRGVILNSEMFKDMTHSIIDMVMMFNPMQKMEDHYFDITVVGYEDGNQLACEEFLRTVMSTFDVPCSIARAKWTVNIGPTNGNIYRVHFVYKRLLDPSETSGVMISKDTWEEHEKDIIEHIRKTIC